MQDELRLAVVLVCVRYVIMLWQLSAAVLAQVIGKILELVVNVINLNEVLDCEVTALPFW